MRIYRRKFKDRNGQTKELKKWGIELRDHNGIKRRFAGFSDKAATEETGRNIQRLISFRSADLPPDSQLIRWIEKIPAKLRSRLAEVGLLDSSRLEASKLLEENIMDFEDSLHGKEKHIQQVSRTLRRIIEGCGFRFWSDVRVSDVETYLAERRKQGLSKRTIGLYAEVFGRFGRWMLKEGRISEAPVVVHCERAPRNYGRAFELDEFEKLLAAAFSGPVRKRLSGRLRYVCYIVGCETGLRRGELRSLTPASINFKSNTVFVGGEHTKNGEDAVQEFSTKTAGLLKELVAGKLPNVQLFPLPEHSSEMIQSDCKAAGIEVTDNTGRSLNFHSLRHSCGSFLTAANVHPRIVQGIMRHKSIDMTMNRYTHILRGQRRSAIEGMAKFVKRRAAESA